VYCKIHSAQGIQVLAACDKELAGCTLKKGDLDFKVSEAFYKGRQVSEKELSELLDEIGSINLVGKKVTAVAMKKGLISEKNIIKVEGIPHAQIYRIG